MFNRLIQTSDDPAVLLARVTLGLVMFPHGAQHALGWFSGYGFHGTLAWMTGTLGFPAALAAIAIVTEIVAPILLVTGTAGRVAAAGILGIMLGAASTHLQNGFFMNWFGALKPGYEGFEYHIIAGALALVVIISGSGAVSVDRLLGRRASAA